MAVRKLAATTFSALVLKLEPHPNFFSLDRFRKQTQVEALAELLAVPAVQELCARIDRIGNGGLPLSTVIRWLMAMAVCHENVYSRMYRRFECDSQLATLVFGPGVPLPDDSWISNKIHAHLANLLVATRRFHFAMVRHFVLNNPGVARGLVGDGMGIRGYSNPERGVYKRDRNTGRFVEVGRRPATDPEAHFWKKGKDDPSAATGSGLYSHKKGGFGFRVDQVCFVAKPLYAAYELNKVDEGNTEPPCMMRLLDELFHHVPELLPPEGEIAVFIADAGYSSKEMHGFLHAKHLEPIIPAAGPDKIMKADTSPTMASHGETLRFRQDYTPVCSRDIPLKVLPSTIGGYPAQRFRCPMKLPGECPNECSLAPKHDDAGKICFPTVTQRTSGLKTDEQRYQHPLFPRLGDQFAKLFAMRTVIERGNSLIRNIVRFGGEGEARVPIRGLDNQRLRLGVGIITLNLMAILNDGLDLPAHVGSHWGIGTGFFLEDEAA